MKQLLYLFLTAGAFSVSVLSENPEHVKVRAVTHNVNIRAMPDTKSEVVAQISTNDELLVKSVGKEWVELVPPCSVEFWVLSDYIRDGAVKGQNVNVRAGPGINFSIVGQVNQGMNVVVKSAHLDWVSISPPESCSLWVYRPLVEFVAEEKEMAPATVEMVEPEEINAVKEKFKLKREPDLLESVQPKHETTNAFAMTSKSTVSPAHKISSVKPPPSLDLDPSYKQGQWKQVEGILRPRAHFFRVPSRYRLITYDSGQNAVTVCYVKGNKAQLKALLNRHLIISGREYRVHRMRYPVLVPERIVLK